MSVLPARLAENEVDKRRKQIKQIKLSFSNTTDETFQQDIFV